MKKRIYIILAVIFLIAIVLRLPTLYTTIMDIDESQYGEFAIKVVDKKGGPYESSIGEKPPLLYYYYIVIFKLFGNNNYFAIHLMTLLLVLCTIYILYLIGKERWSVEVGLAIALLYAVFSTTHEPKIISTNGETLMNLPMVLGVYYFTLYEKISDNKSGKSWLYLILTGIFTGLAFLYRHQAGMQIAFLGIYFLTRYLLLDKSAKSVLGVAIRLMESAVLGITWIIPFALACLWIIYIGVFDEFFFWVFEFNFSYIKAGGQTVPITTGFIRVGLFILFTLPAWVYLIKALRKNLPSLKKTVKTKQWDLSETSLLFAILWFIFSAIPVFVGGRFYSHYFIQLMPALFVLAGLGTSHLIKPFIEDNKEKIPFPKTAIIIFSIYAFIFFIPRIDADTTKAIVKSVLPKAGRLGVYPEQKTVGEYIKSRTNKGDHIFVWGFATPIYVYADRACGSRFSWADFLSGRIPGLPPWEDRKGNTDFYIMGKAWWMFCEDMNRYQPEYFVDTSTGDYHEYGKYPITKKYTNLFDMKKFIKEFYNYEIKLEGMTLYRRKKRIQMTCEKESW